MAARQGANAYNDLWGKVIGHEGAEGLVLFGHDIGNEGAGSLADVLGQCALGNTDNIWRDTDRGITDKADTVAETRNIDRELVTENLARLNLSRNAIGNEGASRLAGVLGQCPALAHVDLSDNRIGADGAGALAGVLAQCPALAHLNLGRNQIGDQGTGRLTSMMRHYAALAHLNLSHNEIRDKGVGRLAGVLGQCAALAHLDLSWNDIGPDGAGRLAGALRQCSGTQFTYFTSANVQILTPEELRASSAGSPRS
jgi:Ran GTPase-activating protein (RanGAP) involved in mRNA processing and transport